ncbi:MAG: hypothetical protein AB7J13_03675 [Pyrinomonadaceae bacterium]
MNNPILEELHATREKLLREAGGDLHRYVKEARKRALASGRLIAKPTERTGRPITSVNVGTPTTEPPSPPRNDR